MSPDRLYRHDHPDDPEFVKWGDLRTVAISLTDHFRGILQWMGLLGVLLLLILVGLGALMLSRQNANTRAAQLAVCAVAGYADTQARNIHQAAAQAPQGQRINLERRAVELHVLSVRMRDTGILCPPGRR